jgi:SAM-dependent methyltransferase/GNAT superfamily N-acetyltransferase
MFIKIVEARTAKEKEEVFRFRYRIYGEELGKALGGIDHDRRVYTDSLDEEAVILAAVDQKTGHVVGTLRSNTLADGAFPGKLFERMNLGPMVEKFEPGKVGYSSAFMVDPVYRGKTVASLLFLALYRHVLRVERDLELCVSEMALVNLYYQIGFRPYSRPFRLEESAGLRQPLVQTLTDRQYLEKVDSPLLFVLPQDRDDGGAAAVRLRSAYDEFLDPAMTPMERRALWAALAHGMAGAPVSLFHGFTDEEMANLLDCFPTIRLSPGEKFYRRGEHERGMGVVVKGKIGITLEEEDSPHFLAVLGPGEVCGEMASLLRAGRTATTVALEESEMLLLPYNLLDKLKRKDVDAAYRVSINLNCLLSMRLDTTNDLVASLQSQIQNGDSPIREQAGHVLQNAPVLQESYSIVTLDDPLTELQRLEAQARAGWGLELHWLRRAGFRDHATFLDLGSGPGVTSIMMAQTFPRSRVFGVEPEAMLRQRAAERAAEHGLEDRVTFIDGLGQSIPLPDDSVDFCYARFVLQHIPDPVPVFRELRRVTRPGGVVVVADVDDEGVVIFPEPEGLRDFQLRAGQAQRGLGGDRSVGRKLISHMHKAGFVDPFNDVAPVTSHDLPKSLLVDIAFSFKEQTLKRAELWKDDADARVLQELNAMAAHPDGWMLIPVFFCHGIA